MRRKTLWLSVGLLLLIAGSVVATVAVLVRHQPAFYGRCAVPPGPERVQLSEKFQTELLRLVSDIKNGGNVETGNWRGSFSDALINSYLQDQFLTTGAAEKLLPDGVSEPRIVFEKDRIRLAFRYGTRPWSTIISVDFRVWVAQKEPNVVILQLQSLHAGALPISAQSLLEELSESLRRQNIQVTWYRHEGNPTAALKFQTDQQRPAGQVKQVELKTGTLTILGDSGESVSRPAPSAREKN
jgi:hypothetical protein